MMSKEKKSPLLIASFISLLSFVSLLITLSLPQKLNQPQVLGVIAPPRTSNNLVPCSVIESWQKQYCSTTNISPVPTKYIIPTPSIVKITPTIVTNIPLIERAYPTTGKINEIICFYGSNFIGQITYPITTQPKIEFFDQGTLLLSESSSQASQHGKWEDKQICTTITDPAFSGKGISVTITNYSQNKGNYYYYFQ